jgi:ADP-ribosyl-[dinitrogen reductase] hydrolase
MAPRGPNHSAANEDRFLGALLGLAIGDALGMPVEGLDRAEIAARYGALDGYHPRVLPDGTEIEAGEFTDETEVALCVVEALTTNRGTLDEDLIGARMSFLARTDSRRWLGEATLAALDRADRAGDWQVPLDEDGPATGDVATRGVPIGLLHAVGRFAPDALRRDAERVTRLTHGSPAAIAGTVAVAYGVNLAARAEVPRREWARETARFLAAGELAARLDRAADLLAAGKPVPEAPTDLGTGAATAESVAAGFSAAMAADRFEDAVFPAANAGGAAGTVAAIAGALAGAAGGASGIPQTLIDGLGGRIYVSLAAPWFYRAALQVAGLILDLRPEGDFPPPRPTLPPRQ